MKNSTCRFCANLGPSADPAAGPWDTALLESTNFVVWPTVGSIVEGWLLVVPKHHHICIGAFPDELFAELDDLLKALVPSLSRYGSVALFEHGPAEPNQPVGCGIDHAHLHVVPTQCDLMAGANRLSPELGWVIAEGIRTTKKFHAVGLPYLYLEQPLGKPYLTTHPDLPSQLFRKVIAAYVGEPDRYDWRRFPEERNVSSTIRKLRPLVSSDLVSPSYLLSP